MVTRGLLVRLQAKPGMNEAVEAFLLSAVPLVSQETETTAWFAIHFGHSEYGIFDAFPDEAGRDAHLSGPIAQALMAQAEMLFAKPPRIQKLSILADKLPGIEMGQTPLLAPDTKALLLTFKAKSGHEKDVAQFLRDAQPMADEEPKTTSWFALQLDDPDDANDTEHTEYGIFDTFPDNAGRLAHLSGPIALDLGKHALTLLGSVPHIGMLDILAEDISE